MNALILFKFKAGQNCCNTNRNIFTHAGAYITFKVSFAACSQKQLSARLQFQVLQAL
jgi:hypothetical protein